MKSKEERKERPFCTYFLEAFKPKRKLQLIRLLLPCSLLSCFCTTPPWVPLVRQAGEACGHPQNGICKCVKQSTVLVALSYRTLCDLMDCGPPGSSVHGIVQARILEWVAMPFSRTFPTLGLNPHLLYLLHWQVGSLPLVTPGKTQVVHS